MSQFLFLLLVLLPQQLAPSEIVDRVSRNYGRLDSFSADFEQISQDSSNQKLVLRGLVYLKTGRRARFEYLSPEKKTEYFDGKNYTRYTPPPINQALVQPMGQADSDLLAIIQVVGNRETPWKNQFDQFYLEPVKDGNRVVRLHPAKNKDLKEVLIEVNPGFFIVRLALTSTDGQRNEFRFTNISTERRPDSLFKFVKPPGAEVITQ
jgi:outer membrane lipoprotein-sorting protein